MKNGVKLEIAEGALSTLATTLESYGNYAVVVDAKILEILPEKFNKFKNLIPVEATEENKSIEKVIDLTNKFSELGLKRNDCIVCVGGGIIGDLAGFAASIYLRGIDYIQVPTTLLAMVDSSLGGKTGVNTDAGKNLLGTTSQPKKIICDLDFLKTHSDKLIREGLAESIKHAFIADLGILKCLPDLSAKTIKRICKVKLDIVRKDPFEKNVRKYLNVGHTIAHAIEKESNYKIPHGEAVAIGIKVESALGFKLGYLNKKNFKLITETVDLYLKPSNYNIKNINKFLSYLKQDKKNTDENIGFAFIAKPGKKIIVNKVSVDTVLNFLQNEY